MNIVILGPGAIGALWAVKLRQAGHRVSVWARQADREYPVSLDGLLPVNFQNHTDEDIRQADLIFVTVKSWQIVAALDSVSKLLQPETMLLLMHNGMGVTEELGIYLETHPCLIATTSHGALKQESRTFPVQVSHTGKGETWIGAANQAGQHCTFMTDVLNHAFAPVYWHHNMTQAQWQKLAVNCVINPLTAINQCVNGQLASSEFTRQISALITEISRVMNAEGLTTDTGQLKKRIYQVIENTGENYSSMYQDIFRRRTTEIDYITGYLLKVAEKHQIAIPEHEKVYHQIKHIEMKGKQDE
ncbi:2-dehydropantoate 2-reductase [Vibrio quintilis]|uniref:2-dehydropantoate 2-reductase n=1 Tax=Vibrio quintilis TaxID=1117707 RepID=A0A1M7Z0V4_9VIBR|nr:2-dehydropantoate 2-reductase [Vibrio quintilis]SHO58462.1 2-dehydropantoate 2-reductase [Vibrio quintilis]